MTHVNAIDIAKVLATEFPAVSIIGQGNTLAFQGKEARACRRRAKALLDKARVFNAHADVGHVGNKRNWWKRV